MSTLVYSPGIRVHIESEGSGIIDVSGDITDWSLTRRSNTVSSFTFTLQNTQRKYDGIFRPSDRITVELKRITWVRVFTGSLNNSPIFSAWPRALPMSASCSLKKLQFWPWDPTTTAASEMINKYFASQGSNITSAQGDGGLKALIQESLERVCSWDSKAIHIGQIPMAWFDFARETESLIDAASNMQAVLGATATIGGVSISGNIPLTAGTYGGMPLLQGQVDAASDIYAVILAESQLTSAADQDKAAVVALTVAGTESSFNNNPVPDKYGSIGYFQQIPAWGSTDERLNVTWSTKAFLFGSNGNPGLFSITNWKSGDPASLAQRVEKSAYPSAYFDWVNAAEALVTTLRASYTKQISDAGTKTSGVNAGQPTGNSTYLVTGANFASTASDLITSRPAGSIRYQEGGDSAPTDSSPTVLDCSSLVEWVYYHATGKLLNHRLANDQYQYCKTVAIIPLDLAQWVQGALLFNVTNDYAGHVGVSLGDGRYVAANNSDVPLVDQVKISLISDGAFNTAGLLPSLDYTNAAHDQDSANKLTAIIKQQVAISKTTIGSGADPSATTQQSTTGTKSVYQQIVTAISAGPSVSGTIFGGARELINNQPFLPWLKNLTNSSMRSFCSAPNGDFIAWFPDYFNVWKTAAIMDIQPIELQDFTVDWSDQQIVTHEFVIGSLAALLDQGSGNIVANADASYDIATQMMSTKGIAIMEFPQIFKAIYRKPASSKFVTEYLTRFGARPNVDQMANIQAGAQEFYMALWNFMYYWAAQFTATVPMTFMPELYPGMILKIPAFDFQCYVTEVTHTGSYGTGGSFTTQATICAPARTSNVSDLFDMLPLAG